MKKKYLIIGSLTFLQLFAKGQPTKDTTSYKPKQIDIELVYNQYVQDGNNSAVTGGIGTEKLSVYGPSFYIRKTTAKNAVGVKFGADVISSASTDNIDFVPSSASKRDTRAYAEGVFERKFEDQNLSVLGGMGASIESDYFSISGRIGFTKSDKEKLRTFSLDAQIFNDDLRWGRLNASYRKPVKLIYPDELRYKEWFDEYRRRSYNLKLGLVQILNRRNTIGIFPEVIYQSGLLSTPFHRVYFSNDDEAVENLPRERLKTAIAVRLNTFTGSRIVLRNTLAAYHDSFGILATTIENETAIKLSPFVSLLPGIRFYMQSNADDFAPYKVHESTKNFYTSDYDLSKFKTVSGGMGVKLVRLKDKPRGDATRTLTFRYYYMHRTTGLNAHTVSCVIHWETRKGSL